MFRKSQNFVLKSIKNMFQIFVEKNEYFFIPKKCEENFAKKKERNKKNCIPVADCESKKEDEQKIVILIGCLLFYIFKINLCLAFPQKCLYLSRESRTEFLL